MSRAEPSAVPRPGAFARSRPAGGKCPRGMAVSLPGCAHRRVNAAACFLVASYHASALPLRRGNETRSACRRRPGGPPPKSPGGCAGENLRGENGDDGMQSPSLVSAQKWPGWIDFDSPDRGSPGSFRSSSSPSAMLRNRVGIRSAFLQTAKPAGPRRRLTAAPGVRQTSLKQPV